MQQRRRSPRPPEVMASDALAERMAAIASSRGWGWPSSSALAIRRSSGRQSWPTSTSSWSWKAPICWAGRTRRRTTSSRVTYPTDHLGFTYPPFSALLFAPFAHFPARACDVVFSWVNLAALFGVIVVSLRAVCRALDKRTVLWWGLALVLPVLLFDPVRQTFLLGQVNIILALMVVADLTMDLPLPRGILVGLAAAIKVTPIILIPYLFLTRQGRAGVRASASFVAAALLAVAFNASTSWSYWTHYIRDPQRAGMLSWIGNQGILGAIERMLGRTVTTPTSFMIVATVGLVGLVIAAGHACRSSPVLGLVRGGGHGIARQPGVVVAPLHLDGPLGGLVGAGRGPAPRSASGTHWPWRYSCGRRRTGGSHTGRRCASPVGAGCCRLAMPMCSSSSSSLIGAAVRVVRAPTWSVPYASAGPRGRWRRRAPTPEPG